MFAKTNLFKAKDEKSLRSHQSGDATSGASVHRHRFHRTLVSTVREDASKNNASTEFDIAADREDE